MREAAAHETTTDIHQAVDRALREAGGGRMAGVRIAHEFGRRVHLVQFVRGTWLCTATVDAATGEVTGILDDGPRVPETDTTAPAGPALTARLDFRTIRHIRASDDDPALAYVATDTGVGVVRLGETLLVEEHHTAGCGAVRLVAPVPGGVVAATGDGLVFRLDAAGRTRWTTRLPSGAHTLDASATRVLAATDTGAIELDAGTGRFAGLVGGPVRAAAYLSRGERILAGRQGDLTVVDADGMVSWQWEQSEYPERMWVRHDRVYLAGEGGLKEIVPGEGVVARWSVPGSAAVDDAVVAGGWVFTRSGGTSLHRHGYATASWYGAAGRAETITALERDREPWLLTGHRDGLLTAQPL